METFFSFLTKRVQDCSSLLCVGLDPRPEDLPHPTAEAALDFCRGLVEETAPYAAAFKPNAAFFEAFGPEGWEALKLLVEFIRSSSCRAGSRIPVILDAKRGDIASTARAYARSAFETIGVDAITLSPYLGRDAVEPFLGAPKRGAFLLCKTSNPGAAELQDLPLRLPGRATAEPLYAQVARLAQNWNLQDNLGLVVGATQVESLARVRAVAPEMWILAPGVGAQGANLEAALQAGLRPDGRGMLVNISRGISQAPRPGRAAAALRDEIVNFQYSHSQGTHLERKKPSPGALANRAGLASLADQLLDTGCVKFGDFTLKSGLQSPIYIDLRRLVAAPEVLAEVAAAYVEVLQTLDFDLLAALPYAALPIGTAVSLQGGWPLIYPRKEVKTYGTKAAIEGVYRAGQRAVVIDDLITTGGSKLEAIEALAAAGLSVTDILVLIDRRSDESGELAAHGFYLHSIFTLPQLLDHWQTSGRVAGERLAAVRAYLAAG